jgi:hypothetical protein
VHSDQLIALNEKQLNEAVFHRDLVHAGIPISTSNASALLSVYCRCQCRISERRTSRTYLGSKYFQRRAFKHEAIMRATALSALLGPLSSFQADASLSSNVASLLQTQVATRSPLARVYRNGQRPLDANSVTQPVPLCKSTELRPQLSLTRPMRTARSSEPSASHAVPPSPLREASTCTCAFSVL